MIIEIAVLTIILILNSFIVFSLLRSSAKVSRDQNLLFGSIIILVIIWVLSIMITDLSFSNHDLSLLASRVSFVSSALISFFYYLFVKSFNKNKTLLNSFDYFFWIPLTIFFSLTALSDLILTNVELISSANLKSHFGVLYLPYSIFIALFFIYSTAKFYKIYQKEKDLIVKSQIYNILIGSTLSIVAALVTNILFPVLGFEEIRSLGPLTLVFFLGATYYSIIRYRFLSINLIIGKVVYIFAIGFFPYIIFMFFYFFQTTVWGSPFVPVALISGYFISIVVVYIFLYFNKILSSWINKIIININFDPTVVRDQLSQKISIELDITKINQSIIETLYSALDVKGIDLLILDIQTLGVISDVNINFPIKKTIYNDFITLSFVRNLNRNEVLIKEELDHGQIPLNLNQENVNFLINFMSQYKISLIVPLNISDHSFGALFLEDKKNNIAFNLQDITFLQSIVNIASVSISRAILYNQVQHFAGELQQKVDAQTTQLQEDLRKERDMMDILSHELRTPLGTARNAVVMSNVALKDLPGSDPVKMKISNHLNIATENLRREIKILETVLSSTKIENNRLQINFENIDAKDVVNDTIESYKTEAEKKKLELLAELPENNILCYAGRDQTQEIIDNLVSNAIKYTPSGSIKIKLDEEDEFVKFSVIDTGEGIPKDDIPNLGKKFYRANMYINSNPDSANIVRPGGTGIGLYVVFGLVKMMNGKIDIQSEVGKGSTFSVYLPKAK